MTNKKPQKFETLVKLFNDGSFTRLEEELRLFLETYPEDLNASNLQGLVEKKKGNISKARIIFETLSKKYPKNAGVLSNLGNLAQMQGDSLKAISLLQQAFTLQPEGGLAERILQTLGIAQKTVGKRNESLASFQAGRALNGALRHEFQAEIADFYRVDQQYSEAIEAFENIDIRLSRTHQLECIYRTKNISLFHDKLDSLLADKRSNPLLGALVTLSNKTLNTSFENPFCSDPQQYVFKGKIPPTKLSDDLIKSLIEYSLNPDGDFIHQDLLLNGKQSNGNLLKSGQPFVKDLRDIIMACVKHYRKKYTSSLEVFLKKWPEKFEIYAWLVNINQYGNLQSHMHKEGWLSGSLYLRIPRTSDNKEGSISFSLCGSDLPTYGCDFKETIVPVLKRDIIMFPSSLFHKTIPFKMPGERVSLAFDIIPR